MYFRDFFVDDLAQASYMVACEKTKKAAVIDPERNVSVYIEEAKARGFEITHVLETHLHADFISGHVELAKRTGAKIYIAKSANAAFDHQPVQQGDEIEVGNLLIKILETPGHTPESLCFTITDTAKSRTPQMVFTGDTLFVGSVGRPDLFGADKAKELAEQLYESLHGRLLELPSDTQVLPAHGAGSFCGAGMGAERVSTIGKEKSMNCSFVGKSKKQFVDDLLSNLPLTPTYFRNSAHVNRSGPALLGEKLPGVALTQEKAQALIQEGAIPIDTRDKTPFGEGHLPGALFSQLGSQFATWVGWVTKPDNSFFFVLDRAEQYPQATWSLLRIGFDRVAGYLEGGMDAWRKKGQPIEVLPQISVEELQRRLHSSEEKPLVLDVRTTAEWNGGHIVDAQHIPLSTLAGRNDLQKTGPIAIICGSGFRSSIASSLLARQGHRNLINVVGGMNAWRAAQLPVKK